MEKTRHWKESKVAAWYYAGSRDGCDYFVHVDLGVEETYRVRSGEIALPVTFPLTDGPKRRVPMPWGPYARGGESGAQPPG